MAQPLSVSPIAASPRTEPQPKLHSSSEQDFGKVLDSVSRSVHEDKDPIVKPPTASREQQSTGDTSCQKTKHIQRKDRLEGPDGSSPKADGQSDDQKPPLDPVAISRGPAKKDEATEKVGREDKMRPNCESSSASVRIPTQDQQSKPSDEAAFNPAGSPVACGQILPGDGTDANPPKNVSATAVADCATPGLEAQLHSQKSGGQAPAVAMDGLPTPSYIRPGNPDSQKMSTAIHPVPNVEVKQTAEQTNSTPLNRPNTPNFRLEPIIPVTTKDNGITTNGITTNGTTTADPPQSVSAQQGGQPKVSSSRGESAQGATAGDFLQVLRQKIDPDLTDAQLQVSVTAKASAKADLVIPNDPVPQLDPQVTKAALERDVAAKEDIPDAAKMIRQIQDVIPSQQGETKDSIDAKVNLVPNTRDANRLVFDFNGAGKSKDLEQPSLDAPGLKSQAMTTNKLPPDGSANRGDDEGTSPELEKEATLTSSSERGAFPDSKSASQPPNNSQSATITREASQEANARGTQALTGLEANTTPDRIQRTSTDKPPIKLDVLPEPGATGNGVGFGSRTASVGGTDPSTTARPTTPSLDQFWTQAEKANVISQLIEKAHLLSASKNSELMVSLKPEFLGRLNVHATMLDNSLVATITAESPAVKSLLESHIPNLQHSLQEQGLSVSKITVVQGNELSFSGYEYSDSSHHHNLESQQGHRLQWLDPLTPLEPDIEESEALTGRVVQPNQSIHLIA